MFTGLVESKGSLVRRTAHGRDARLVIRGELVGGRAGSTQSPGRGEPIVLGESIAIDGVCLTVATIAEPGGGIAGAPTVFEVDASSETLEKTTLGSLAVGSAVNLERALPIGGRLGGHIVSGHVDGVGHIVAREPVGAALKITFEAPAELARYIAPKGSICVNGVSLTVNGVAGASFDVMLIPHTRDKTSLDAMTVGVRVNLEVDLLARYVARLLDTGRFAGDHGPSELPSELPPDSHLLERLRASGYV